MKPEEIIALYAFGCVSVFGMATAVLHVCGYECYKGTYVCLSFGVSAGLIAMMATGVV